LKKIFIYISLGVFGSFFTGCASMYPGTLDENPRLEKQTAVILVGVEGSKSVDYLQYCSFACKNYRMSPISNEIIALTIDSPVSKIKLETYTLANVHTGYTPQGTNYGFYFTQSLPLDINKPGIYYHGILNTDTGLFSTKVNHEFLSKARIKYKERFGSLKPINFKW
jgi:hypothetical protein